MIRIAICDERLPDECRLKLVRRGFIVVSMPPSSRLPEPLASHTDMLLCRIGDEYVTSADYLEEVPFGIQEIYDLTRAKFHFTADVFEKEYPRDAIFNCLTFGKRLFIKADTASEYVINLAREKGLEIVNIKQGYPACTVLKLSDEAAITADDGMARALSKYGIRVYKIEAGGIALPPYEYGFIGGAAGVCDGVVYFAGDITAHPSYNIIKEAAEREGLKLVSLGSGTPLDVGGIFFAEAYVD